MQYKWILMCFGRFSKTIVFRGRQIRYIYSLLINTLTWEINAPPSPSGRTPAGEAKQDRRRGGIYRCFAAIVSDYWLVAKRFHTSPCPFRRIRGGVKSWCPSVRPLVTLFFVSRTSYRRKSPFGLGFFLIDRARSLVVHHLVWGYLVKWFGRGGHRRGRRLRSHVLGMGKNDQACVQYFYPLNILFRSNFFCIL
jgi:hypothetical protein